MIRFSVVHYQPGPNWDFGNDYSTPEQPGGPATIEDVVFSLVNGPDRVLPMKFEAWDERYDQAGGELKKKIPQPKLDGVDVKKAPKRRASIAIDFNGPIAIDLYSAKKMMERVAKFGCEFHLVTGKTERVRKTIEEMCALHGIKFSSMNFYPVSSQREWPEWEAFAEGKVAGWKAQRLAELDVDILVDDNYGHIRHIVRSIPSIVVLRPVEE